MPQMTELEEWQQAARVEARLRREFLSRAVDAEGLLREARDLITLDGEWYDPQPLLDRIAAHFAAHDPDVSAAVSAASETADQLSP